MSDINAVKRYYKQVCDAYRIGNIETSYNSPIIALIEVFGAQARDLSGGRSKAAGENIDILLWHEGENTNETEPFAGIEVKKVGGIDQRANEQIVAETERYGNAVLTDNLVWWFWETKDGKPNRYSGVQLIEIVNGTLQLKKDRNQGDKDNPDAFYVSEERFWQYVEAGSRLRKLHLLEEKVPVSLKIEPNTANDLEIGAIKYANGVLYINKNKLIIGIPKNVWNYYIGGYQVLSKWFKSHKGELFDFEKMRHIENVVGALAETIKIQNELVARSSASQNTSSQE